MKGHTLPGIKQSPAKKELIGGQNNLPTELKEKIKAAPGKMYGKSPAKQFEEGDYYDTRSKKSPNKQFEEGDYYDTRSAKKKSPGKWVQFIPMALSAASSLSKMGKNKEE